MAYHDPLWDGVVCGVMDARCKQVYTALFAVENQRIKRLTPDEALYLEELKGRLAAVKKKVIWLETGPSCAIMNVRIFLVSALPAPR